MAEFERIFSKFSTAEELTGAAAPDGDDEADDGAEREDGDEALVKAGSAPLHLLRMLANCRALVMGLFLDVLTDSVGTCGAGPDLRRAVTVQAEAGARRTAEEDDSDEDGGEGGGSKRKKRLEARMHIGSLKQAAPRPDVVEVWDVTSTDPKLLVWLKVRAWNGASGFVRLSSPQGTRLAVTCEAGPVASPCCKAGRQRQAGLLTGHDVAPESDTCTPWASTLLFTRRPECVIHAG